MSLRINEGYIITDSIHIDEHEFVLGVNQHSAQSFVTWRCDGGDYYYWGHYFSDLFSAQKDLVERAAEKVRELQAILDEKKAREPKLSRGARYRPARSFAAACIPSARRDTAGSWCA